MGVDCENKCMTKLRECVKQLSELMSNSSERHLKENR